MAKQRVRKRKIDSGRIRARLYRIVLDSEDNREVIAAARVLLQDAQAERHGDGVDSNLLRDINASLKSGA